MKIIAFILLLLCALIIDQSAALDETETRLRGANNYKFPGHRKLLLFQEIRCKQKVQSCQAEVGVKDVPLEKWSTSLSQFNDDSTDLFSVIRQVIEIANEIQFLSLVEQIANTLGVEQIADVITKIRTMSGYITTITTAIDDGDITTVLRTTAELITMLGETFKIDVLIKVADMIQLVVNFVEKVVSLIKDGGTDSIFDTITAVVSAVTDFLSDFLNILLGVFDSQFQGNTDCEEDLMKCSKDKLLLKTVPEMISMSFLAMADED